MALAAGDNSQEEIFTAFNEVSEELLGLVNDFSKLQQKMISNDSIVQIPISADNDPIETNWENLYQKQQKTEEVINPMLDQWQSKVMPMSTRKTFKLKSINQSIRTQVEGTLNGRNYSNILRRLQTLPEESGKLLGMVQTQSGTDIPIPLGQQAFPEIYNDGDFYTKLIRERLQSGLSSSFNASNPLEMSQQYLRLQQIQKRKRKKKTVDTKASKGRRIRYNVHDKLVSFMAPMPYRYPNQDSILSQALFRNLLGRQTTITS